MKTKNTAAPTGTKRKLPAQKYRSFRLHKKLKHPKSHQTKIPSTWHLFTSALAQLKTHRRFFGGVGLVFGLVTFLISSGVSGSNISELKEGFDQAFVEPGNVLVSSVAVFGLVVGSSVTGQSVSVYHSIMFIICSLAIIWGLRQAQSETAGRLSIRDGFYKGMQPLVPFLLVLFLIGLELSLISVAGVIYGAVSLGGIAVTGLEQAISTLLVALLIILSLYLMSSTILAVYIVTLPNMTPMKALRAARKLVQHRRLLVIRKLLVYGLLIFALSALILIPAIAFATAIAGPLFFVMSIAVLPLTHAYVYNLYRSML